jgi:hypothetical protein
MNGTKVGAMRTGPPGSGAPQAGRSPLKRLAPERCRQEDGSSAAWSIIGFETESGPFSRPINRRDVLEPHRAKPEANDNGIRSAHRQATRSFLPIDRSSERERARGSWFRGGDLAAQSSCNATPSAAAAATAPTIPAPNVMLRIRVTNETDARTIASCSPPTAYS